jgi:hypothetical protein
MSDGISVLDLETRIVLRDCADLTLVCSKCHTTSITSLPPVVNDKFILYHTGIWITVEHCHTALWIYYHIMAHSSEHALAVVHGKFAAIAYFPFIAHDPFFGPELDRILTQLPNPILISLQSLCVSGIGLKLSPYVTLCAVIPTHYRAVEVSPGSIKFPIKIMYAYELAWAIHSQSIYVGMYDHIQIKI